MEILVAEDDRKTAGSIEAALVKAGMTVHLAATGTAALDLALHRAWDTVVLDIMMPGHDGLSILRAMRDQQIRTPVIVVSARGNTGERVEGLRLGADDYLPKPFALMELIARINALVRRAQTPVFEEELCYGEVRVNFVERRVFRNDCSIHLAPNEFVLLDALVRANGDVCSYRSLLDRIWGFDYQPQANMLAVLIYRLRRKLDPGFAWPMIKTLPGIGVRLQLAP